MYDPQVGRWISEDPIGFDGGDANLARYVWNSPTNFTDPSGLSPNQGDAIKIEDLIEWVKRLEKEHPKETPEQILVRLRDAITQKKRRSGVSGGSGSSTSPAAGRPDSRPRWSYIYTKEAGWIDLGHFFEAARYARHCWKWAVEGGGIGVEIVQYIFGHTGTDGVGSSAFTVEDLPSNKQGAIFGRQLQNDVLLSKQVSDYFKKLGATAPTEAPDWKSLPPSEAVHEHQWKQEVREKNRRAWSAVTEAYRRNPYKVCCFVENTFVLTPFGQRLIQTIRSGDKLLTIDLSRQSLIATQVVALEVHDGDFALWELKVDTALHTEVIRVTNGHPFFAGDRWVHSHQIDGVLPSFSPSLNPARLSRRRIAGRRRRVYNVRTQSGNYLVGTTGLLVSGVSSPTFK